jgi:hypothetical protein
MITAFALFNVPGDVPEGEDALGQEDPPEGGFTGDINPPSLPTA